MTFNIAQDPERVKLAHQFQISANIESIRLLECSADIREPGPDGEVELRLRLDLETAILGTSEGRARFSVRIAVQGEPKESDDSGVPVFRLSAKHALEYRLKPGYTPSKEELDGFREGNCVFQCWPYAREFFQSLSGRMAIHVPPLPFLRLVPKTAQAQESIKPSSTKRTRKKLPEPKAAGE